MVLYYPTYKVGLYLVPLLIQGGDVGFRSVARNPTGVVTAGCCQQKVP